MTYNKLPKNTPEILRKAGLKVVETDGWYNRGRPASTGGLNPAGVLCHHTATKKSTPKSAVLKLLINGRSDLPGPLCHFGLGRDGTVYLIAAGRANHAGKARSSGTVAGGDGNQLYWAIEAFNDGVGEDWPKVQLDAYVTLCAVICNEITHNSYQTVRGHKETSVTGKIDPTFDMAKHRSRVKAKMVELKKPPVKKAVEKVVKKVVRKKAIEFHVFLNPTNTHAKNALEDVKAEMARIKKLSGPNAILITTEMHAQTTRQAAMEVLGRSWKTALENENMVAWRSPNWTQSGTPVGFKLAKDDPSKARVSPARAISEHSLENKIFTGGPIDIWGTHWVSEANCIHKNVPARAWREQNYKVQLEDWLGEVERAHKEGRALVLAGDFNTGVYFTSKQLFAKLQERVGDAAKAVFLGGLDCIFTVDSDKVKFSEPVAEVRTNIESDHDLIMAHIRATKI